MVDFSTIEPWHGISKKCGMWDQQRLRPACAYTQSDQSLCLPLEYSMSVKLLTEHHMEFVSLKGGCLGSSESRLVRIPLLEFIMNFSYGTMWANFWYLLKGQPVSQTNLPICAVLPVFPTCTWKVWKLIVNETQISSSTEHWPLTMLNPDISYFENMIDSDQLAS